MLKHDSKRMPSHLCLFCHFMIFFCGNIYNILDDFIDVVLMDYSGYECYTL